ncbi:hypothetical protein HGB07_06310 [Candidatus Roizmanbacteria bacterium]|nr:hypothetical protein [Candidatus Roizmanbacteria bacterium]
MPDLLNPESLPFFFGPHFDVDVALTTAANLPNLGELCESVERSIEQGVPHTGLHLVGYENIDTGLSALAAVGKPNAPSMVSFYAESSHRVFGGATLVCVPLAFCSRYFRPHGEFVVYRHTYKRRLVTEAEYFKTMESATDEEKMRLFLFTRSRDGFETIPGLSYVGISSRPWQKRFTEHIDSAIQKQSTAKFHEAIRQMQGQKVIHVHDVSSFGLTEAEARECESKLIASSTLFPLGLNMKR